jgi:hypothetical protein
MILDLNIEAPKAKAYFDKLLADGAVIELKRVSKKRTIKQNSYVHKLFTLWGMEYGYTTEEAKTVVKRALNYTYERNGQKFLQRTSDMDTGELTTFIDKFRNWSAHNGYYLPSADEFGANHAYYEQQIERAIALERRYGSV